MRCANNSQTFLHYCTWYTRKTVILTKPFAKHMGLDGIARLSESPIWFQNFWTQVWNRSLVPYRLEIPITYIGPYIGDLGKTYIGLYAYRRTQIFTVQVGLKFHVRFKFRVKRNLKVTMKATLLQRLFCNRLIHLYTESGQIFWDCQWWNWDRRPRLCFHQLKNWRKHALYRSDSAEKWTRLPQCAILIAEHCRSWSELILQII